MAFTLILGSRRAAAANLTRDLNFDGTIVGDVYAQPLYIEGGPSGRPTIIAVTESNNVYALDAVDGSIIWQRNRWRAGAGKQSPCASLIDTMGITGTPIVDLASRALFLNAMITPDGGATKKHLIFSLNVDTGDTNSGLAGGRGGDGFIQRDALHCSDPTATTGARHRGQHSLCRIWEFRGLRPLSWLAGGRADK